LWAPVIPASLLTLKVRQIMRQEFQNLVKKDDYLRKFQFARDQNDIEYQ